MRKPIRGLLAIAAIVVAGFAVAAISSSDDPPGPPAVSDMEHGNVKLAKGEMQQILNAVDVITKDTPKDQLVAEGRAIFRDTSRFENGESCQTCHAEGSASANLGTMFHDRDANVDPMPPTDFNGPRDPPALWGMDKTAPYFWDASEPTLESAVARPVMGHMREFVAGGLGPKDGDPDCAPDDKGKRSDACIKRAGDTAAQLIAYIKTLDPPASAFDQGTMSKEALAGEKIFQGKGGCIECHGGPLFTDNLTHNTGVPQVTFDSPYRDGTGTITSDDKGAPPPPPDPGCDATPLPPGCDPAPNPSNAFINTPQLRDLKNTAPYMHNGAFQTLEQVVRFYNGPPLSNSGMPKDTVPANPSSNLAPLNLTPQEMNELVAYLESL
jgi:mono/diheme cytochrome c family protein